MLLTGIEFQSLSILYVMNEMNSNLFWKESFLPKSSLFVEARLLVDLGFNFNILL